MKKNKLFVTLFAGLFSALMLFGCTPTTTVPPTTEPPTTDPDPVMKTITEYFNGNVYVEYMDYLESYSDTVSGEQILYTSALDRQIDVFVQDAIYRLTTVYGGGAYNTETVGSYGEGAINLVNPINSEPYKYGNNVAQVSNYYLINNPSTVNTETVQYTDSNGTVISGTSQADISQVATYANEMADGVWNVNTSTLTTKFNLTNAINGGMQIVDGEFVQQLNSGFKWNLSNSEELIAGPDAFNAQLIYQDFYINHAESIKLDIARILNTGTTVGTMTYKDTINNISHLGFTEQDKENIVNYFKTYVIGSTAISYDNSIKPASNVITGDTALTTEARRYKAYNLLVPAIINQAFSNKFSGTQFGLYAYSDRLISANLENPYMPYNRLTNQMFTVIKLVPKVSIAPTKLVFSLAGVNRNNINLSYSIYSTSSTAIVANRTISGTSLNITLDLSSYYSNTITPGGYIELSFAFTDTSVMSPFSVTLTGYYDKI